MAGEQKDLMTNERKGRINGAAIDPNELMISEVMTGERDKVTTGERDKVMTGEET